MCPLEYAGLSFLTVVIGDGDSSAVELADLGSFGRFEQLNFKVFVLFKLHVIHNRDVQRPVSLLGWGNRNG